jgi:hypothetical protein
VWLLEATWQRLTMSTTITTSIAEALGFTTGGPKDPNQSWTFWQYYQCVKAPGDSRHYGGYICSKTRVPFFEIADHRFKVRAPSILSDSLQRLWIWQSYSDVSFWPPQTR